MALRTPAAIVPTHGTELLGQRYAYDFVSPTGNPLAPFGPLGLAHALTGVPVSWFAGWGAPIHAAAEGTVLASVGDWPDRTWVHLLWNLTRHRLGYRVRPVRITPTDWRPLAGNYLVIEGPEGVTFYAHLRQGSVRVRVGDRVREGDPLGKVGNSGRSSMPHLHFHLMDGITLQARGRLCGFREFECESKTGWRASSGLPEWRVPVRYSGS